MEAPIPFQKQAAAEPRRMCRAVLPGPGRGEVMRERSDALLRDRHLARDGEGSTNQPSVVG